MAQAQILTQLKEFWSDVDSIYFAPLKSTQQCLNEILNPNDGRNKAQNLKSVGSADTIKSKSGKLAQIKGDK